VSELRSSLCERRLEKDSSGLCAIACQNCAVCSVFPPGMTSHSKIAQFNLDGIGHFRHYARNKDMFPYRVGNPQSLRDKIIPFQIWALLKLEELHVLYPTDAKFKCQFLYTCRNF